MSVVFGLETRLRLRMRTKLENGVLIWKFKTMGFLQFSYSAFIIMLLKVEQMDFVDSSMFTHAIACITLGRVGRWRVCQRQGPEELQSSSSEENLSGEMIKSLK